MIQNRHKISERKRAAAKYEPALVTIDPEQQEKRFVLLSCIILFLYGVYQSVLLYGHHIMPSPDFPSFVDVGRKLWSLQIPRNYQRGPTYGLIVYPLTLIMGGQHPELTAAWLFNSILQPCNLVLMFLIGRQIVGKSAFWLALIAILNPWLLEVFTKPLAEVCLIFFMLITLLFIFRGSRWSYLLASAASLVRYECAMLILAAFVMDMIRRKDKKERIRALYYSIAASIPLGIWLMGAFYFYPTEKSGTVFYTQFLDIKKLADFSILKRELDLLFSSTFGILFQVLSRGSLALVLTITSKILACASFTFGVIWGFAKKQWKIPALLIFFVPYMIAHISYAYSEPRFYVPVQWIFLLICLYGFQNFWLLIKEKLRIPKYVVIGMQILVIIAALVWISKLAVYLPQLKGISSRTVSMLYVAIGASVLAIAAGVYIYREKHLWRNFVILSAVCLMIISNQFAVAVVLQNGQGDAEFKLLLDWYIQNAKHGEKMVTNLSDLLGILDPSCKDFFVSPGQVDANSPKEFIEHCYEKGITYVTWDSRKGLHPEDIFYKMAKYDNIKILGNPRSNGPYEFIKTILNPSDKSKYINIFRLRPRSTQP